MSAGNDRKDQGGWSAEEEELRALFERTALNPGAEALARMSASATRVAVETQVAGRGSWRRWAVGALIAAAAVVAMVVLGGGRKAGKADRTVGVASADVIQDYRASTDAAAVAIAVEDSVDPFVEQFEDPMGWDDEPGLLDGLAVLAGPGSNDDTEAWEQLYDEMLDDWDDLTDDEQAAFE